MLRVRTTELELRSKLWVKFCESIWAELIYSVVYLRSRVTNKHDSKKNPCVRDFGEIGCDALVHMPELKCYFRINPRAEKRSLLFMLCTDVDRVWLSEAHVQEPRDGAIQ